jgi:hypothetical protein
VPHEPSFVPRKKLVVEDFFGEHEDVEWHLATDLTEALELARAREQHELAFEIFKQRRRHRNKVVDVATALGVHPNRLTVKLHGHVPATEADLVQWCWLTGERRRTYAPEDLWASPYPVARFPLERSRR